MRILIYSTLTLYVKSSRLVASVIRLVLSSLLECMMSGVKYEQARVTYISAKTAVHLKHKQKSSSKSGQT